MRKCVSMLVCALSLSCVAAESDEVTFTVQPISFNYAKPLPENLNQQNRTEYFRGMFDNPYQNSMSPRFELGCLITGLGLVSFPEDALKIDFIKTRDGKDISRDYRGLRAYAMATTKSSLASPVADDGKNAVFMICGFSDELTPGDVPHIKGSITVDCSMTFEQTVLPLKTNETSEQQVGPFTLSIEPKNDVRLMIQGNRENLISLTFDMDGQTYDASSTSGFFPISSGAKRLTIGPSFNTQDKSVTYQLPTPQNPEIKVTLKYWTNIEQCVIPFDVQFQPQTGRAK